VITNCFKSFFVISVRLVDRRWGHTPINATNGAVQIFTSNSSSGNKMWYPVCDVGFTDSSARKICVELGLVDGRAIRSSAYGNIFLGSLFGNITNNTVVSVQGCESTSMPIKDCVKFVDVCETGRYASVMCRSDMTPTNGKQFYISGLWYLCCLYWNQTKRSMVTIGPAG
jgi:hypothetical protein